MQPVKLLASRMLPFAHRWLRNYQKKRLKERLVKLQPMTEERFRSILTNELKIRKGDTIFIHSSFNRVKPDFSPQRMMEILIEEVGKDGTICVPTYPPMNSIDFLRSGEVFDIRNTPSRTGVLTEIIRTDPRSKRSLHPTKSVSAIGRNADYLVKDHQLSPYPYDGNSPYYRIIELDGKYIGLGVNSYYIASLHCVDDILKDEYPVQPYIKKVFKAKCRDGEGNEVIVETLAHTLLKTDYDMHRFVQRHISKDICNDHDIEGREFFTARMKPLYEEAMRLARKNVTIYPRSSYKLGYLFR